MDAVDAVRRHTQFAAPTMDAVRFMRSPTSSGDAQLADGEDGRRSFYAVANKVAATRS
jgi:hypothetical protein